MSKYDLSTPSGRARQRVEDLAAFFWHLGVYIIINTFLWLIIGDLTVTFWVAVPWGLGLAFHALAALLSSPGLEQWKYSKYLEQELRLEAMLEDEARRKEMVR